MKAIGGYFGLEVGVGEANFHENAIALNTGRNALEYILLAKKYSKVFLPYFTCDVLLEPLNKNNIQYEFYSIDRNFEPKFDYKIVKKNSAFLYTNYFGVKNEFIKSLKGLCENLIIDNAQSFYSLPEDSVDTFYSPRKFFGVSDGAYLYTDLPMDRKIEVDISYERFGHLLKRLDLSAEEGYADFCVNDQTLENNPIRKMSNLTEAILSSINYKEVSQIRQRNYRQYHDKLSESNKLNIKIDTEAIPMVYPYWCEDVHLRQKLRDNRIYTAKYWPNVPLWSPKDSLEIEMFENIVYLPVDQRYSEEDIKVILKIIDE